MRDPNPQLSNAFKGISLTITPDGKMTYCKGEGSEMQKKNFSITLEGILTQIQKTGFRVPYTKETYQTYYSEALEQHAIPYMVFPYYFFVWTYMRIPSLSEYIQMYFAVYCNECEDGKFTFKEEVDNSGITFTKEQLVGRISRSYNSFTREIHLLLMLREKFHVNVGYDLKWDLNGVDLLVKVGGKYVGIATYVESARSNNYKQRKNTVRHDYSKIRMVDMRAELKEAESSTYSVNNVKLYRPEYVARVYQNQICTASTTND